MIRCPKCRSASLSLVEMWNNSITYYQRGDGMLTQPGCPCEGHPERVVAFCPCGHYWTIRGISSVRELMNDSNALAA